MTIRLTVPSIDADELNAVREVLESGFLVQGPKVAAFEQVVAEYVDVRHAVAVSSGTAALHLALLALGVGPGDLVVTTAYSWPATANVIDVCGAQPLFVDIQPDTYNIDPQRLEETVRNLFSRGRPAKRVRAILPVHAFGNPADMPAINAIAQRYDIPVVEDAACALGSTVQGKQCGSLSTMGCFSFHPRKAITTGEGGMITTNDDGLADRLRAWRNHGQDPNAAASDFILAGLNYRLTDLQGALGLAQMRKLDRILSARRRLAAEYDQLLSQSELSPQQAIPGSGPNYQSYVPLLSPQVAPRRAEMIEALKSSDIQSTIGTWHIPLTRYYREKYGYARGDFPNTDHVFDAAITLPLHEFLSERDLAAVVAELDTKMSCELAR